MQNTFIRGTREGDRERDKRPMGHADAYSIKGLILRKTDLCWMLRIKAKLHIADGRKYFVMISDAIENLSMDIVN